MNNNEVTIADMLTELIEAVTLISRDIGMDEYVLEAVIKDMKTEEEAKLVVYAYTALKENYKGFVSGMTSALIDTKKELEQGIRND